MSAKPNPAPRRAHHKSRGGCKTCKAKKIKCDEQVPCSYCARRNQPCSLAGLDPSAAAAAPGGSSSTTTPAPLTPASSSVSVGGGGGGIPISSLVSVPSPPSSGPGTASAIAAALSLDSETAHFEYSDMALFHHYMTETAAAIGDDLETRAVWQDVVPPLALAHPYLMHELLACAAAHLWWRLSAAPPGSPSASTVVATPPTPQTPPVTEADLVWRKAVLHQSRALPLFRAALAAAIPDAAAAPPLFACGGMINMFTFATARDATSLLFDPDDRGPPDWMATLIGTVVIFQHHAASLRRSSVSALVNTSQTEPDLNDRPARWTMDQRIRETLGGGVLPLGDEGDGNDLRQVYDEAVLALRQSCAYMDLSNTLAEKKTAVWRFAIMAPARFREELGKGRPAALAIMAWWALGLLEVREKWYFVGKARKIMEAIRSLLPAAYLPLIAWPSEQVGLEPS